MANYDQRAVLDYRFGQLSGGVTSLDTTLASTAFVSLPSDLTVTKYMPIVLADDSLGLYEVVWVTAHSGGSQSVTVLRGREGSSARAWAAGTTWRVAPLTRDTVSVLTRATLPADPHIGMRAFLTDENRLVEKVTGGWKAVEAPFGHVGCVDGFQPITGGNGAYMTFSAAQELLGGMTFSNTDDALVVPIAGLYDIHVKCYVSGGSNYGSSGGATINSVALPPGAAEIGAITAFYKWDGADYVHHGNVRRRLAAGDKIRLWQGAPQGSTWGITGYNGAFLEVLYVGP